VSAIVLIGPTEALPALRAQLADVTTSLQMFTDHEVREAVEYIATTRPAIVAVEEVFAVSPRGEALVGRIMDDPGLSSCEIRILALGATIGDKNRRKSGTGIAPAVAVAPEPAAGGGTQAPRKVFDRRGTRRAERFRMLQGVSVTVDGNPAELVDLSTAGAQVLSRIILRPNQRVRIQLPEGHAEARRVLRCAGSVVWASFEMPPGQPPRYRAGLKLSGVEIDALQNFADRHRAPFSDEAD
jgi:hypothetical protein